MLKSLSFTILLLSAHLLFAQVDYDWVSGIGGTQITEQGWEIVTDHNSNIYISGYYSGTVDFDPGPGVNNQTSAGDLDIFIVKLDSSGNLVWVNSIGGANQDRAYGMTITAQNQLIVTGSFRDSVDFDPGPGVNQIKARRGSTVNSHSDAFVMKLDLDGNLVWVKNMGGDLGEIGYAVQADINGNIYSTGTFFVTADFDPGPGTFNLISSGVAEIYVSKLDSNGNFIWAKRIGGPGEDQPVDLQLDPSNNVVISGFFLDSCDFDPGVANNFLISNGFYDAFLVSLDSNGTFNWAHSYGASAFETIHLSLDNAGNCYATGQFGGAVDFDGGPGSQILTSMGALDIYLLKLDAAGNFQWAFNWGGPNFSQTRDLYVDVNGDIFVTGTFGGNEDFDPGPGTANLTFNGGSDIFVEKFDAAQQFQWVKGFGGFGTESVVDIKLDNHGGIVTLGRFRATTDFNHNSGVDNLTPSGGSDVFVHRISECVDIYDTIVSTTCRDYTFNNVTYTQSGIYRDTVVNGCNSYYVLDLTINPIDSTFFPITACDIYQWRGTSYDSTGHYLDTLINSQGCDSILILDLTVNQSRNSILSVSWCGPYSFNGQQYTQSGTYFDTLNTALGCDSNVVLELTIDSIDASVSQSGNALMASNNDANYQWLDCDDNFSEIAGETNQSFTAKTNGNYALRINNASCIDTSNCFNVTTVSIQPIDGWSTIKVYPNPTTDDLIIDYLKDVEADLTITNITGKVVLRKHLYRKGKQLVQLPSQKGIYFVSLLNRDELLTLRVVKN